MQQGREGRRGEGKERRRRKRRLRRKKAKTNAGAHTLPTGLEKKKKKAYK
jgi:hypothetical protein